MIDMNNLADVVLDYLWFLNFGDDESFDPDDAIKLLEGLSIQIEDDFTEEEKRALMNAAQRRLDWWLSEPEEHGYSPRGRLTSDQKSYLEALITGRFDGYDLDDDD
jgi:hypothetical protein